MRSPGLINAPIFGMISVGGSDGLRKALSEYLRDIRDPRRRQGRMYPLTHHAHLGCRKRRELTTRDVMAINVVRRALRA
jgi:hypothetical protein